MDIENTTGNNYVLPYGNVVLAGDTVTIDDDLYDADDSMAEALHRLDGVSGVNVTGYAGGGSYPRTIVHGTPWWSGSATGIPTADPAIAGRPWNDAGTVKISAG